MRLVVLTLGILMALGCVRPTVAVMISPTATPAPHASTAPIEGRNSRVVVLSPGFFEEVIAALPELADKVDARHTQMPSGVAFANEYDVVTAAFERHLLDRGFRPVTQSTVREVLRTENVANQVRELATAEPDGVSLQQLARTLSPALDAPLALTIRNSAISFADEPSATFSDPPGCSLLRLQPLVAWVDALLIDIATGEILWSGEAHVRTSDLFEETVAIPRGPDRANLGRDYGDFRIVGQDDGSRCAISLPAGYYCWETGVDSGHCHRQVVPAHPEANAHLADAVVELLVGSMRFSDEAQP